MSNAETGPSVADIHHLEAYRSPEEIYDAFYNQYSPETFTDTDGRRVAYSLLNGRVLHMDETNDRTTHLMVHVKESDQPPRPYLARMIDGQPHCIFPYANEDFAVITTDGISTVRWRAVHARGLYKGRIDTIRNVYNPDRELVELTLRSEDGQKAAQGMFSKGTGNGMFAEYKQSRGWILSEQESALERSKILLPPAQPVHQLGALAVAS